MAVGLPSSSSSSAAPPGIGGDQLLDQLALPVEPPGVFGAQAREAKKLRGDATLISAARQGHFAELLKN